MKNKLAALAAATVIVFSIAPAYANSSETAAEDYSRYSALVKDYTPAATATPTPAAETSAPETGTETVTTENENSPISGTTLILILAVFAAAGIGIYYFKVVIPKRKLEQADDLGEFDFDDETDTEEVVNEDNIVKDDTKNI